MNDKRAILQIKVWIRSAVVKRRWDLPVAKGQNGFYQTGNAGGSIKVANVGFYRSNAARSRARSRVSKYTSESRNFYRISKRGA